MESYDVVVIGAGLAGLQCARLLAQQGLSVALADRKQSLAESVHTTGIFVRRTLEDFDFPQDLLGPAVRHVRLYSPARRALMLESKHDEFRVGRMSRLYLHYLEECEQSGIVWMPGVRYTRLEATGEDSIIRFETKEGERRVRARFVVGADGAQSKIACDLDLDSNREWIVGVEDVLHGVPLEGPPVFHCFLDPEIAPGYLAWLVNDGEEAHLGVGGYAAQFNPREALDKFRASLSNVANLSRARLVERRGGRIPVGGVLRRIANRRGLLVGDAAGAVSPLTAGGLDPCMRLSQFAAIVIADYLTTGNRETLAAYSGERFRSRFVSRLWMRHLIAGFRQPMLIEAVCAALRLPPFRHIARHVFFGRGSFPDAGHAATSSVHTAPQPLA